MRKGLYAFGILVALGLFWADYQGHTVGTFMGFSGHESGHRGAGGHYFFNHK